MITIILTLILTAITIQAFTGSGLFKQAGQVELEHRRGQIKENLNLNLMSAQAEKTNGSSLEVVTEAHKIISSKEKMDYLKQLSKSKKEPIIGEISNKEDYDEVDWYFYVTVDDDVYKITAKGIDVIGKTNEIAPVIKISRLTNTTSSITVTVETQRNTGGKVQYYIKGDTYTDYKMIKESEENTYTFEGLKQGIKYSIKVIAVAKNKKTAEATGEQITGQITELREGDIEFTASISSATNSDVVVTAKAKTDLNGFKLLTSKDPSKGWSTSLSQTFKQNGRMYVILWDGTNYGTSSAGHTVTNIDKLAPIDFTPKITAKDTNSITVDGTTTDAKATDENMSSGIKGYRFSIDGGKTYTEQQSSPIYKFEKLSQIKEYTIKVEAEDNAGNKTIGSTSATTGNVTGIKTGDVTFTYSPSTPTNQNVTVTISGNNTGFTLQYKTEKTGVAGSGETADWKNYTAPFTLTRNQAIYARVVDSTGQAGNTYATGNLTNIDKLAPKPFTPKVTAKTTNSITVDGTTTDADKTTDNASSGIKEYRFSKDGGKTYTSVQTSPIYKFEKLSQTTGFTIVVEATDKAGNKTTGTVKSTTGSVTGIRTGDVTFTYSPSTPTNQNVTVTISGNNTGFTLQYKTEKSGTAGSGETADWKNYTAPFTLTRNQAIYARVVDSTGQAGNTYATGNLTNIDKLAPKPFTPKVTAKTTNSITVDGTTTDADKTADNASSGIKEYRFSKDGGKTYSNAQTSPKYTFSNLNQTTDFTIVVEATDKAGNKTTGTVKSTTGTVTGIKTGDVTFTYSPSTATNQNVTVTISGNNTGFTLQYKTEKTGVAGSGETADWKNYTAPFTLTRNQAIYARVVDSTGQAGNTYATGNLTNIDKLAPAAFTPSLTATTNSIKVTANVTDTAATKDNISSGIKDYRFSINNGAYTEYQTSNTYTFSNLAQGQNYTIKVEARDKAGNTTIGTASKTTGNVTNLTEANVKFTISPSVITNKDVTVTASTTISGFTIQTSKDGKTYTNTASQTFSSNGTMYVRLTDGVNVGTAATATITTIDKTAPTVSIALTSTLQTINSISLSIGAKDTLSGLGKIEWYYGTTNNPTTLGATTSITALNGNAKGPTTAQTKTQTISGLTVGTTYYFKAVVYDVAGNQVSSTVISAKTNNPTAGDVSYTPSDSSWKVDNVKSALDYFFNR